MKNPINDAHKNPGKGLAAVVAALAIGPIIAFSPAGQKAYNTIKQYVSERVVLAENYENNEDYGINESYNLR